MRLGEHMNDITGTIGHKSFLAVLQFQSFISLPCPIQLISLTTKNFQNKPTFANSPKMSAEYEGQDPLDIAKQAERDLNSNEAETGNRAGASDSTTESGIDTSVTRKFPGSTAEYGSHVSGAGDNRDIPVEEGGDIQKGTGRLTKARDFDQGEAGEGPEDILKKREDENPGSDEFGRSAGELKDETSGTPGGGDGAGAPVSSGGPGYTDDSTGAAGGRVP